MLKNRGVSTSGTPLYYICTCQNNNSNRPHTVPGTVLLGYSLRLGSPCNAQPATQIMIDTYISALGFTKESEEGRYSNGTYLVWDVVPRNVLVDADGDMYVVDAEIKKK